MGQHDEMAMARKSKGRSSAPAQQGRSWRKPANVEACDITAVDPTLVGAACIAVAKHGAALMISTTRDGGAVCITLFDNDSRDKMYAHSQDEIEVALQGLIEDYS